MCTAASQKYLPDFLTNLDGTSVTVPPRDQNAIDRPLRADDVNELAIERRREELRRQYDENSGSIRPNPILTRKDIMEEIT